MRALAKSLFVQSTLGLVFLLVSAVSASAQLIRVEAGASDMVPTVGGSVSIQGRGYEGYLGAGTVDGVFRLGTTAKTSFGSYQFTAGDQTLAFNLPTYAFCGGQYLSTRGVGAAIHGPNHVFAFAGATKLGVGTPMFQAFQATPALGALFIGKQVPE